MISRVRIGMWETNSSTMNQVAIYRHSKDNDMLENSIQHIILTGEVPDCDSAVFTNDTTFDTETKIQILYSMIREIKNEAPNYENDRRFNPSYGCGYGYPDWERYLQNLLKVLEANGVDYEFKKPITTDYKFEDDNFGLSGIQNMDALFLNINALRSFIFDHRSGFTFGEVNAWPDESNVGYTKIPTGDNYVVITI